MINDLLFFPFHWLVDSLPGTPQTEASSSSGEYSTIPNVPASANQPSQYHSQSSTHLPNYGSRERCVFRLLRWPVPTRTPTRWDRSQTQTKLVTHPQG